MGWSALDPAQSPSRAATAPKSIVVRGGGAAACVLACTRLNVSLSAALNRTASTLSTPAAGVKTAPGCMMTKLATPGSDVTIVGRHVRELHDVWQPSQRSHGRITGIGLARASVDGQVVTDAAGYHRTMRRRPVRRRLRRDRLELSRLKHRRTVHDRAVKRRRSPTSSSGSTSRDGGSRGFCSDRSCRRCRRRSGADLARVDACHERRTSVLSREPQLPHHASAWTNQPPQDRGGHRGLHDAGTQRVLHSDPVGDDAFLEWRDDHQPLLLIAREQRDDVPRVPDLADPDAHLAEPNPPLRLEQLPHLRPGRVHQRLLLILDDARAEPGSDAEPGIQVEAMDPIGCVRQRRSVSSREHPVRQAHASVRTGAAQASGPDRPHVCSRRAG